MFAHFNFHRSLLRALNEMNIKDPTAVQVKAIPLALEQIDLQINAETGSGKTIAFLVPMLHTMLSKASPGGTRALVLLPTRELAAQVHGVCSELAKFTRLKIDLISGGDDINAQRELLQHNPDVIIATPGRLLELLKKGAADFLDLEMLVLDEADRMLDLGMSDDVLAIAEQCNSERQTLLVSASSKGSISVIAQQIMNQPELVSLNTVWDRHANILQQMILSDHAQHKQEQIYWLLRNERYQKAIVFANSREKAEKIGSYLMHRGLRATVLHGSLEQNQRDRAMDLLHDGKVNILVATDLAARGLDIEGVDLVLNSAMARRGDSYLHRIGRTGRAGNKGLAITLVDPTEWNLAASIERYLKQKLIRRIIEELPGHYRGPERVKASGKAYGVKNPDKKKLTAREKRRKNNKKIKRQRRHKAEQE